MLAGGPTAPDVIVVGEIRDAETMQQAMHFAETGHLCLATLHSSNACQAIERVVNFFPKDAHTRLLQDLSLQLKAVVSQRLVPGKNGQRVAAVEVLPNSPGVAESIRKGETAELKQLLEQRDEPGVQSFDQALFALYQQGAISPEMAIEYADSQHNVKLQIDFHDTSHVSRPKRVSGGDNYVYITG